MKLLKLLPYALAIITGVILYLLASSNFVSEILRDLLVNIAAAFFAIPLLHFCYESAKSFSQKKLNKEIFDYAKMQVDRELLSIINQLQKIVYTLEEKDFSDEGINKFLSLKNEEIKNRLNENKYLGFQVFKHWEVSEKGLEELLKNPYILEKMEDKQIIPMVSVLKNLRDIEEIQKIEGLYTETEETAKHFSISGSRDINQENKNYPDRHLLLKHLKEDKFLVYDFGDIPKHRLDKCLKYYKINEKLLNDYAKVISNLLNDINIWLASTGLEFVIDTKIFRMQLAKHEATRT